MIIIANSRKQNEGSVLPPGMEDIRYAHDKETLNSLLGEKPRFIFFAHWNWHIPAEIYENHTCIGFHMTDLPYGRGGSPLQNLIINGHKETKITAIKIVEGMDCGAIYMKQDLTLEGKAEEIYDRAYNIINGMIMEISLMNIEPIPQDENEALYFIRRTPDQSEMQEITYDHIRMLDAEGYPHANIKYCGQVLEFTDAKVTKEGLVARCLIK